MSSNQLNTKREIRLEARIRNNRLWHLIKNKSKNVSIFCQTHGLCSAQVGDLLNLKRSPLNAYSGEYRPVAIKLSEIAGILPEDLFPERLYRKNAVIETSAEIPIASLTSHERQLLLENREEHQGEIRRAVRRALSSLPARQREIVEKRFGIYGDTHFGKELAQSEGVTTQRIFQLERRAKLELSKIPELRQLARENCLE